MPAPARTGSTGLGWAGVAGDLLAVVVFAAVGRSSHGEADDLAGLLHTAGPFLLGCLAGLGLSRWWLRPFAIGRLDVGLVVWVVTVFGGLTLRVLGGATAQLSFVIVTAVTLAMLLLGWRAVLRLVQRVRSRRGTRIAA